jgi:hypothetical protein
MAKNAVLQMELIDLIGRRVRIEKEDLILEGILKLGDSVSATSSNTVARNWELVTDKETIAFTQNDGWKVSKL